MVQEPTGNFGSQGEGVVPPLSLPIHTRLGEFEIVDVIGEGGFSIVYLAHDHQLQRTVAIKEYLPGAIAFRNGDGVVLPRFGKYESTFKTGLQSFLKEARILAQFEHYALIRIHRFWEQHGTAYMVMQYCRGHTLRQILRNEPQRGADEAWLRRLMEPVLDALELLHSKNCYHRDLSPDNIMILESGAPMLLDFGAARQVIGDMTQALTVILKPGFAPIEQYADDESMKQGPWTDIYGIGAVLYHAVTGKSPTASVARLVRDPLKKLAAQPELGMSSGFAAAVDHALALFPADRPQSVELFCREFMAQPEFGAVVGHWQANPLRQPENLAGPPFPSTQVPTQPLAVMPEVTAEMEHQLPVAIGALAAAESIPSEEHEVLALAANIQDKVQLDGMKELAVDRKMHNASTAPDASKMPAPMRSLSPVVQPDQKSEAETVLPPDIPVTRAFEAQEETIRKVAEPAAKHRWGLFAGCGVGAVLTLAAAAYFFDHSGSENSGSGRSPSIAVVDEVKPTARDDSLPSDVSVSAPAKTALTDDVVRVGNDTGRSNGLSNASTAGGHSAAVPPALSAASSTPVMSTEVAGRIPVAAAVTESTSPVAPATTPGKASGAANNSAPSSTAIPASSSPTIATNAGRTAQKPGPADLPSDAAKVPVDVKPSVEVNAVKKPGASVRLSIKPWGRVLIDGVEAGVSPPLVHLWLPEGQHSVVVENGDFQKFSASVEIVDKKDVSVSHRFGK